MCLAPALMPVNEHGLGKLPSHHPCKGVGEWDPHAPDLQTRVFAI